MIGQAITPERYAIFKLSVNQTTDIGAGNRIAFDVVSPGSSWITLDVNSGTKGQITFVGPGRYLIFGGLLATGTSAEVIARWYNVTDSVEVGNKIQITGPALALTIDAYTFYAGTFFNLTAADPPKTVELRQLAVTSVTNYSTESWAFAIRV